MDEAKRKMKEEERKIQEVVEQAEREEPRGVRAAVSEPKEERRLGKDGEALTYQKFLDTNAVIPDHLLEELWGKMQVVEATAPAAASSAIEGR